MADIDIGAADGCLSGRAALVTGGSRGLGLAIAQAFVDAGARVMVVGRNEAALDAACSTRPEAITAFSGDATAQATAEAATAAVLDRYGRLDILVNNAGGPFAIGPLLELPADQFDATINLNLRAPFLWSRAAWLGAMREHGGVILNIASIGGILMPRAMGAYATAKAGLLQMTRVLAAELGPKVRVNAIAPGIVRSDATAGIADRDDLFRKMMPLERVGEPSDIASAALFLVSDGSSWITGETLVIDGGTLVGPGRLKKNSD